jgi:N-acetyl-beta-hexosaminidase
MHVWSKHANIFPTVRMQIIGISAHQWSESVRTDEQWEYMIWPRTVR